LGGEGVDNVRYCIILAFLILHYQLTTVEMSSFCTQFHIKTRKCQKQKTNKWEIAIRDAIDNLLLKDAKTEEDKNCHIDHFINITKLSDGHNTINNNIMLNLIELNGF